MESNTMLTTGLEVPVSPRDNHLVHGATVQELLTQFAAPVLSQPNPPQNVLKAAELNINHLLAHLQLGAAQGLNRDPAFAELEKFAVGFRDQLAQVVQINAEAQVAEEMVKQTIRTEGLPVEATPTLESAQLPSPVPQLPAVTNVPA
jgi:hypothetical protein